MIIKPRVTQPFESTEKEARFVFFMAAMKLMDEITYVSCCLKNSGG